MIRLCVAKNMTLKPQESRDNQAGPLHKKKPARVPNGLSLEPCKNNHHHHQHSDQENNPRLAHTQGKRKKKHLSKKHTMPSSQIAANVFDLWHQPNVLNYEIL
ncbi:hypothetical protein PAMP_007440 [Pampus punctatissimus]